MDPDDVSTPTSTNEVVRVLKPQTKALTVTSTGLPTTALPPALTIGDQVQIKIEGQAPPHPQAAGTQLLILAFEHMYCTYRLHYNHE